MSDADTTATTEAPDKETDVEQIEDVQDLKQRRKLQSLLDAEEDVREMRKKAKLGERQGTSVGVVGYRANVEDYLLALRPIIKDKNEELWSEKELGSLTIEPPATRAFFSDLPDAEIDEDGTPRFGSVSGLGQLQPKTVAEFEGLQSILDAPSQFTATWTVYHIPPSGGQKTIQKTRTVDLPLSIVDAAFEAAADFANEHGFGFSTEETDPHGMT
ncbi:hypothetical protein [Halobacterium hubeiense]|uniref:hypothetical protein n=1 Tax=Halobacterium hubeiense TaxID=1407499 RepID=UPI003C77337C